MAGGEQSELALGGGQLVTMPHIGGRRQTGQSARAALPGIEGCACRAWERRMNAWGAGGCRRHMGEIVRHLVGEAGKRLGLIGYEATVAIAAWLLVRLAIWRAARADAARERLARKRFDGRSMARQIGGKSSGLP